MASSSPYDSVREMYHCKLCNIKFTMKHHLQRHCSSHHSESLQWGPRIFRMRSKSQLSCADCDVSFSDEKKLEAHLQTHTGSNQYACEECNAMFVTEECYISHADLHRAKRFACSLCDLDFALRSTLTRHYARRHHVTAPENIDGGFSSRADEGVDPASHPCESLKSESQCSAGFDAKFSIQGGFLSHVST